MYTLLRNIKNMPKPQFQCTCYSALKQPQPNETDDISRKIVEPTTKLKDTTSDSQTSDNPKNVTRDDTSVKMVKAVRQPSEPVVEPEKKYDPKDVTKEDMKWRTPWHQREAGYYNSLRAFYSEHNQTEILKFIQTPINLSPAAIKKWFAEKKEHKEIMMQSYLPERHQTLGNELAAAHFIVHRGGAVKFHNYDKWIKANKNKEYRLPKLYQEDKILQAIDCSDMQLYYEGLSNLKELKQVEWLSFNGVEHFDDWCLDRISNQFSHSLIYLDIRNCPKYTERGLGALYKMDKLKILWIDDMLMTTSFEMVCLMLQEVNPNLDIQIGD
jgi:hypothetical protein